jgi:hypothetical protein
VPEFQPGFRSGRYDAHVLLVGIVVSVFGLGGGSLTLLGLYVLVQFFLFCNVFRVPLWLELAWASVFLYAFSREQFPLDAEAAWTLGSILVVSGMVAVGVATRLPLYHGIYWEKLNPRLPERWAARHRVL